MIGTDDLALSLAIGSLSLICLGILVLLARQLWRGASRSIDEKATPTERPWQGQAWIFVPLLVFALAAALFLWRTEAGETHADLTINVSGKMWTWTFRYPDRGSVEFSAPMLADAKAARDVAGSYDHIVVPVGKTVRIVANSDNVVYSWGIPALGAAIEALPGRDSQSVFTPSEEGRYFGECEELCGLPHRFRPIEIEVVSAARFDQWLAGAKRGLATADVQPTFVAPPR